MKLHLIINEINENRRMKGMSDCNVTRTTGGNVVVQRKQRKREKPPEKWMNYYEYSHRWQQNMKIIIQIMIVFVDFLCCPSKNSNAKTDNRKRDERANGEKKTTTTTTTTKWINFMKLEIFIVVRSTISAFRNVANGRKNEAQTPKMQTKTTNMTKFNAENGMRETTNGKKVVIY